MEAVLTVLAVYDRKAPVTINLENQDPEIPLDVVTSARDLPAGNIVALSNSFGFGGHNAVIAVRSVCPFGVWFRPQEAAPPYRRGPEEGGRAGFN